MLRLWHENIGIGGESSESAWFQWVGGIRATLASVLLEGIVVLSSRFWLESLWRCENEGQGGIGRQRSKSSSLSWTDAGRSTRACCGLLMSGLLEAVMLSSRFRSWEDVGEREEKETDRIRPEVLESLRRGKNNGRTGTTLVRKGEAQKCW